MSFISDEMSEENRKCARTADLQDMARINDVVPTNLRALLVWNCVCDRTSSTASCVACPNGEGMALRLELSTICHSMSMVRSANGRRAGPCVSGSG